VVGATAVVVARVAPGVLRVAAGCEVFVDDGVAAAGVDDCPWAAGGAWPGVAAGAVAAAGAGAAGVEAGAAIALTALRQAADNLPSLRRRHSSASLPPGWTPEQLAMKSERQEPRIASRCAWVGCCAKAGVSASAATHPATSEDRNIEAFLAFSGTVRMPAIASEVQRGRGFLASFSPQSLCWGGSFC
jgi:hypothetical protein